MFSELAAAEKDYADQIIFHEFNTSSGRCFNFSIIDDDVMESVEDFGLSVHVISSISPVLIDAGKRSTSITIVDDDGT